jgi:hypothetical protein
MTHHGGLSLSIIIWRIGGGGAKFPFALGPKNSLGGPVREHYSINKNMTSNFLDQYIFFFILSTLLV